MPELKYYTSPQEATRERIKQIAKEIYNIDDPDVLDNLIRIAFDKNEDPKHVIAASKVLLDRITPAVKAVEVYTPPGRAIETIVRFQTEEEANAEAG